MAKLGWAKGRIDTLAKQLRVSLAHLPHPELQLHRASAKAAGGCDFPREPGSSSWSAEAEGGAWLFRHRGGRCDRVSRRGCVSLRGLPCLQLHFGTCACPSACAGLDNPPTPHPGQLGQRVHPSFSKPVCVPQSSLPVSREMGSCSPRVPEAAKLLWNHAGEVQRVGPTGEPGGQGCGGGILLLVRVGSWAVAHRQGRRIMV